MSTTGFSQIQIDSTEVNNNKVLIEKSELDKINHDLDTVRSQLDNYLLLLNGALILFTVFIAVGSGFSIFSLVKNENRDSKAFKVAMESHEQNKTDSAILKSRENSIFQESQRTLTLVNETLTLATEASKRASKSLENRLRNNLDKLEKTSLKVVQDSQAFVDDKNLTTDSDICSEIHRIGRKIEGLENNLIILEDNQLSLKPYCNFVRATDSYLDEQFDQALEYIENVLFTNETDSKLKSLAYFWKGYIQNNLNEFEKAHSDFRRAYDLATDSRKYELRRIELETRFFNNENPLFIINEFGGLLKQIDHDISSESKRILDSRKAKIKTTIGNIYYQLASETNDKQKKENYYKKSMSHFAELLEIDLEENTSILESLKHNRNRDKLKWTIFGLAESMYQANYRVSQAIQIFKEIVYHSAENEFLNREEKRTKVLAKTTQLICDIRTKENITKISQTKALVDSALSGVDRRLTLYSQLQRRNVSRDSFRNDLEILLDSINTNANNV